MTPATPEIEQSLLDACAREPIRIPGSIQPHGAILVLDASDLRMLQASENLTAFTGLNFTQGGRAWVEDGRSGSLVEEISGWLIGPNTAFFRTLLVHGKPLQVGAHRTGQGVIVEFEDPPSSVSETLEALYPKMRSFVEQLGQVESTTGIAELAVREMRQLTRFNRVMLYSFDAEGAGTVLAEDRDDALPSYLDLRFPASDIPPQARELYRLNRLRLIPTASYVPVRIIPTESPIDGQPLDLSLVALRSVSPVHLEYMRNMGTLTSMSVSILVDGRLWGLISCHNAEPRGLNAQVRTACDFLGQIVSLQIGARERASDASRRIALKQVETQLLASMSNGEAFQNDLEANGDRWLQLMDAQGAALVTPDHFVTAGETPSRAELEQLVLWLKRKRVLEVYATDALSKEWPLASAFAGIASGLMAVSISQLHPSYILWFREEVVRTVKWAGDPQKPAVRTGERLHPRQSFELWKELVQHHSLPWTEIEVDAARDFRNAVVNFVLLRAEERAQFSEKLRASNKELEAFSYSISHDLRAPFRHIVGFGELLSGQLPDMDDQSRHYLRSMIEAALSAGELVDDLLNFSQLGRTNLKRSAIDMDKLVREVRHSVEADTIGRSVDWKVGKLHPAWGDPAMIRQVLANLIDNALKYSAPRSPAVIEIESNDEGDLITYTVKDNGVGFDSDYAGKLFGVFQRLHRAEDFAGTGIGLALIKRIVDRHDGEVFAEGALDQGARIGFKLPKQKKAN